MFLFMNLPFAIEREKETDRTIFKVYTILNPFQVAAHLFQAGANIVKLGIQKTDQTENPVQFLGSY